MSLPTKQRIKRPAEFRHVFARGRRASTNLLNVVVTPNDHSHLRLGLSVSKRVGNAVTRNLVKRRIHSAFRGVDAPGGWDVVVTAKPGAAEAGYQEISDAVVATVKRAGVKVRSTGSEVVV